jgi:hypothetical protein
MPLSLEFGPTRAFVDRLPSLPVQDELKEPGLADALKPCYDKWKEHVEMDRKNWNQESPGSEKREVEDRIEQHSSTQEVLRLYLRN